MQANSSILWLLLAFLPAPLGAQAQGFTLPSGYRSTVTTGVWSGFGYPQNRTQAVYNELRGKASVLTEAQMRRSWLANYALPTVPPMIYPGIARQFGVFEIRLADGQYKTFGGTFASNPKSTPTLVFKKAISLPDAQKPPTRKPMPWNTAGLRFPFSQIYVHSGLYDLLVDLISDARTIKYPGGQTGHPVNHYQISGYQYDFHTQAPSFEVGNRCLESRQLSGQPTTALAMATSMRAPNLSPAGVTVLYTAPQTLHVAAVGLSGVSSPKLGIPIGACQPLMIQPTWYFPFQSLGDQQLGYGTARFWSGHYLTALKGVTWYTQVAFQDSGTGGFSLTNSSRTAFADPPSRPEFALQASTADLKIKSVAWPNLNSWNVPHLLFK